MRFTTPSEIRIQGTADNGRTSVASDTGQTCVCRVPPSGGFDSRFTTHSVRSSTTRSTSHQRHHPGIKLNISPSAGPPSQTESHFQTNKIAKLFEPQTVNQHATRVHLGRTTLHKAPLHQNINCKVGQGIASTMPRRNMIHFRSGIIRRCSNKQQNIGQSSKTYKSILPSITAIIRRRAPLSQGARQAHRPHPSVHLFRWGSPGTSTHLLGEPC